MNVSLIRDKRLDEAYADTVRRILRKGVSPEEIDLFVYAAEKIRIARDGIEDLKDDELARSAVE